MLKKFHNSNNIKIGTWCEIPDSTSINVLSKSGLDFIIIDMEHGTMDFNKSLNMIYAAQAEGCSPIIRVSRNEESDILRALDMAPEGLIVPHIKSYQDCKQFINYACFPPVGTRGYNPYTRSGGYRPLNENESLKTKDENLMLGIILENKNVILELDQILEIDEIDLYYIGAYDLSVSFGIPGKVNHDSIVNTIKSCTQKILQKGKIAGVMVHSLEDYSFYQQLGVQFLVYKTDTSILYNTFNSFVNGVRLKNNL